MKLAKNLAKSAKDNGICKEWHDRLRNQNDIAGMLAMYVKGIDFCMAHDWPDLETLRRNFAGDPFVSDHGVFIDKKDVKVANRAMTVLLGASEAAISFDGWEVGEIYVRHKSVATIAVSGNSYAVLDVYDNAIVRIIATGNAKIFVKNHNNCTIDVEHESTAVVKINNKNI